MQLTTAGPGSLAWDASITHFLDHRYDHGVQLPKQCVGGAFSAVHYPQRAELLKEDL